MKNYSIIYKVLPPYTTHENSSTTHRIVFLFFENRKMELFDLYLPFNLLLTVDYMPYLKVACDKQRGQL